MPAALKLLVGANAGRELPIGASRYLIGRADDCHLRPASPHVSRRHCELCSTALGTAIRDLGSRTGTWVNGFRLPPHRTLVLHAGDKIQAGPLKFELKVVLESVATTQLAPPAKSSSKSVSAVDDDVLDWIQEAETAAGANQTSAGTGTTIISVEQLLARSEEPDAPTESQESIGVNPSQSAAETLRNLSRL